MGVINNQQSLLSILINHMQGSSKSDLIRDLQTFTQETTQSRIQTGSQLTLETPRFFFNISPDPVRWVKCTAILLSMANKSRIEAKRKTTMDFISTSSKVTGAISFTACSINYVLYRDPPIAYLHLKYKPIFGGLHVISIFRLWIDRKFQFGIDVL